MMHYYLNSGHCQLFVTGVLDLLSIHQHQLVIDKVELCFKHASTQLNKPFKTPKINFNQRGKVAGSARLNSHELRFNPILLSDNLQHFLDDVVPHEVCHLLAFLLYGKVKPHGIEWKTLMQQLFNLPGQAYHKMDVTKVAGRTFEYFCICGPIELTVRRHYKVLRGQQHYVCRRCHTKLKQNVKANAE